MDKLLKSNSSIKTIEELKQGDIIYDTTFTEVRKYTYLCAQPKTMGNYHILINENEEPFRIYRPKLEAILIKNFNSTREAELELLKNLNVYCKKLELKYAK